MTPTTAPKVPNKSVVWGAGLLLLSLVWGFGILRLDDQQLMPAAAQWRLALGTGLLGTLVLLAYFRLRRRPAHLPPTSAANWLMTVPLLFLYCLLSFGPMAVCLALWLNRQLATTPLRLVLLPVERDYTPAGQPGDWYVVVPFEGQHPRIALPGVATAVAARSIQLTLQRGGLGYWVIRAKKPSVFAPTPAPAR